MMNKKQRLTNGLSLLLTVYALLSPLFSLKLEAKYTTSIKSITNQNHLQTTITGLITDTHGQPIGGVTILVEQSDKGTISKMDGTYNIRAAGNGQLIFSAIGFKTLTIPINGRKKIDVTLQEDITQLDEVVLNAGYYTVTEKERTGSISTIKAITMEQQPVGNPLAAMQGHLSGVNIIQSSGVPGGGFNVEIRGRNFIDGASDPFYLVDGVPYNAQSLGSSNVSGQILGGNISPLNALNLNDIESIEVLKDADATAIYGSRAANGVVLITTKKGKTGKTRFNAHLSTSLGRVSNFLELMNTEQYLEVRREGITNDGFGPFLEDPAFDFIWPDIKSWDNDRYTDWQKKLIGGTAYRNSAQLSVSGGSSDTQFLVSGAYNKETTVFLGDANYKKATLHSNLNHKSSNHRFKFNLSTSYTNGKNRMPRTDFTSKAYTLEPNAPELYDAEGNINWENNTWDNPLASLEETFEVTTNTLIANALVSYEIIPNLEFKSSLGFNSYRLDSYRTLPSSARNPNLGLTSQNYASLTTNGSKRNSWIVEPQLHWRKQWQELKLDFLVGTTFQEENTEQFIQKGTGFPNDELLRNLTAANTLEVLQDADSEYKYNALFGRLNLKFRDRYIVNFTGRRDGSSRFGPGKQFGNFGAVGMAWLFSEENSLQGNPLLSYGKLRGSFGTTGSDNIGDYKFLDTYNVSGFNYNGIVLLEPTGIFNPLFGWEANKKLEAALELGFFKDRILINSSWYRNRSSNQLIGIPLAATTGFSELTGNFDATVENSGFEVDIRTVNFKKKNFTWSTTFNLTIPKNKLVAFEGLETSTFANHLIIGEPLTIVKLYNALGVDPETGSYQFEDYNGDGTIGSLEDKQWVEDFGPKFYGGLGNTITFNHVTLDFFLQFKNQKAFNEIAFGATPGYRGNSSTALLDRWQQPGNMNPIQRASGGLAFGEDTGALQKSSNAAVSDASFIRLRNISINYKVPDLGNGLDLNVYVQGQNLLTLTNYKGPDPEQPSNTRLPQLRQITLGLQLGF
ncbi:SusC/RagA family TonB-linked outer membrane protein [Maribacter polysiphoniae]|uniref:TonB-linked SusC/RagA family outer membrane protein n=2 Tax=Maribacter polysiphoniae TaxID=429344 RepID=A0A316E2K8_9FLAO|nr:SusC/RagA family TonB-linked outer membrane protein [Maribacter polysiphoniae]PWK24286.1 TonB-linked SusC/RagA family outer membrane protein [Maribacter polysiphoniae]